ncbi:uncharacterized protein LOC135399866 [Ornithodoros turicata]|uniref:uncharacterized protein LOC135399866 n=1 Tax=Ornithodoros turicata TaxID=34597 RepID=UPI00313A1EB1
MKDDGTEQPVTPEPNSPSHHQALSSVKERFNVFHKCGLNTQTLVLFLTAACLCVNSVVFLLHCFGWVRNKEFDGRRLEGGWIFDALFGLEYLLDAISDAVLIAGIGLEDPGSRHGGRKVFPYILKRFIAWNTVSIVFGWCASCSLAYVREVQYDGQYSYFSSNGTRPANATAETQQKNDDSSSIPTYVVVDLVFTVLAFMKLCILYGVYYMYLRSLPDANESPQLFVKTSLSSLAQSPRSHRPSRTESGRWKVSPFPSWGAPTVSTYCPAPEWSSKTDRVNPFPEGGTPAQRSVYAIASPKPAYSFDQLGKSKDEPLPVLPAASGPTLGHALPAEVRPSQLDVREAPHQYVPTQAVAMEQPEVESSESQQLPPFFVTPNNK